MSLGHKLSGLNRTNWENKTDKQKIKILTRHYQNLGYKIPSYLKNDSITQNRFNTALNRVKQGYTNKIEKNRQAKNKININYELKNTLNKFNTTVDKAISKLMKLGYTEKQIDYLRGNHVMLSMRSKSYFGDSKLLDKIDIENLHINSAKLKREMINFLKNNMRIINSKDFINNLTDEKKSIKFYNELVKLEAFNNLKDIEKNALVNMFRELNSVQKDVAIKTHLGEFRDRYENIDELEGQHLSNVFNKWSNILQSARREI